MIMNPTEPSVTEIEELATKIFHDQYPTEDFSSLNLFRRVQFRKFAAFHRSEVAAMILRIDRYKANLTIASLQHAEWEIEQATQGTK